MHRRISIHLPHGFCLDSSVRDTVQVAISSKFLMVRVLPQLPVTGRRHNTTTKDGKDTTMTWPVFKVLLALQYVGVGTVWTDFRRVALRSRGVALRSLLQYNYRVQGSPSVRSWQWAQLERKECVLPFS
jgi:hypothetical protein